jgi:D,D-heptose 1,7-bisphosphate phosphatase
MKKKPAFFLDRDGTICEEVGYLKDPKHLKLIPGSANAIRKINEAGWCTVVISNQSGVARGYMDENDVASVNQALISKLAEKNAFLDGIYYCPHHPKGNPPYKAECECRKPLPGMIYKAKTDLNIEIGKSVVIGDKFTDIQTAQNLNITGVLLLTGFGKEEYKKYHDGWQIPPTFIAKNLLDAVEWFFHRHQGVSHI